MPPDWKPCFYARSANLTPPPPLPRRQRPHRLPPLEQRQQRKQRPPPLRAQRRVPLQQHRRIPARHVQQPLVLLRVRQPPPRPPALPLAQQIPPAAQPEILVRDHEPIIRVPQQ